MLITRHLCLSFVILFLSLSSKVWAVHDWSAKGWESVDQKEGIQVYRKSFADSDVKGVGGSVLLDVPVGKIIWVLMDHKHKDEWIDKFHSAHTIETLSSLESVQYAAFSMPLPISDRDFVYSYKFFYDADKNMVEVDTSSVKHAKAPSSDSVGVRGEILFGKYRLYPREGGQKTYVEVEYLADPKGYLPSWVVNIVQKSWPYKTLSKLRKQVAKDFVKEHTEILTALGVSGS